MRNPEGISFQTNERKEALDSRFRGNDKKGAGMTKRDKEYWIPNQVGDDKLLDPR